MTHRSLLLLGFLSIGGPSGAPASRPAGLPAVEFNDNRIRAGTRTGDVLTIALDVRRAAWYLEGPDHPPGEILAFGEVGKAPQIPGPLIRVPLGTTVRVRVTNPLDSVLVVHGLAARRVTVMDTLVVPPHASREVEFPADAAGTYYYWATTTGVDFESRFYEDSQLGGAFVVDPPGGSTADRILLISRWVQRRMPDGSPDLWTEFFAVNGRPWPLTERFAYGVGDTVRWRIVNASNDVHPLHLHGFYYRIDARGDLQRDTVYWPAQRRMAVTERVQDGQTMMIAWSPDRPGGWLFHCHLNWHVIPNPGVGEEAQPDSVRAMHVINGDEHHDPQHHVEQGMGGLMLAVNVPPPAGWTSRAGERRTLRLFVQSDSAPGDSARHFGYVLQEGDHEPARDSVRLPGAVIVLHRGEPTGVWVINRTGEPTQVHWHGLELESYFDGVAGVGGYPDARTPAILPADSFEMRVTPPRAGSFMYHTHVNDIRQVRLGLYGPLLVLEPGENFDPERDKIFMVGSDPNDDPLLNGSTVHAPVELRRDSTYRFRLMNVTMGGPGLELSLVREGAPVRWTPLAKDGFDLPAWQREPKAARQVVSIGETYDFTVRPDRVGDLALELRRDDGALITTQPFRVVQ